MRNRLIKSIIIISSIIMFGIIGYNKLDPKERDLQKIYKDFEGKTLLIGGWVTPRGEYVKTQKQADTRYKELSQAGITMMYTFDDMDDLDRLRRVMNAAKKNGIDLIVSLDSARIDYSLEVVKETRDHPAVIGYNLRDEPPAYDFPQLSSFRDKVYEIVGEDKIIMINLLPLYAPDQMLGVSAKDDKTSYQVYVETAMKSIRPSLLCTDYYLFTSNQFEDTNRLEGFYKNLFDLKNAGDTYNVDLWGFLQNSGWTGMREPTQEELRFSMHANLAFGFKSLSYFLCWNPHADSVKNGHYDPTSMISYDGKITANYHKVKKINEEVHAMKGVFLDYDNKGIIMKEVYSDVLPYMPESYYLDSFEELIGVEATNNVLIGCFKMNGETGLYIVNCNYSERESNTVELSLNKKATCRIWGKLGLEDQRNSDTITIDFIQGEGKFLQILG